MAKIDLTKEQAEMMQISLDSEKKVLKELEKNYREAISEIEEKIAILQARQDADLQHVVYQIEYQKALKEQAKSALDKLHNSNFETISAYLTKSYETGFIGTLYDMQGQGVPLMIPLNPENMIRAITEKTKLKTSLYEELGFDIKQLSKQISSEISRGFARASTYKEIARGIEEHAGVSKNNSMRIARTEAHRIENEAIADCQEEASKKGADIVRIWSAALDGRTRPTHRKLDGQIREVGEPFEVDGMKVMQPGGFGIASEDINCRCRLNGRARWTLDKKALETLQQRAEFFGLDKTDSFEEFKKKFLNLPEGADIMDIGGALTSPVAGSDEKYQKLLEGLKINGVDYRPVEQHKEKLTQEEIINALAGGDRTRGSCASLGLAYMGQANGWNVLDFRDGSSRNFFSRSSNLFNLSKMQGMVATYYGDVEGKTSCTLANNFLKTCEAGKEYYLCVGRHAAIVRKTDEGVLQYLELQSATRSGWTNFNGNPRYTLTQRFGCSSASGHGERFDFMLNITDSDFDNDEFKSLLGYINTAEESQVKGVGGTIK